jgi:hypothetical protein
MCKEFKTFAEMREFAKTITNNGRYHIASPLRHVSYRRENIEHFDNEDNYKKYVEEYGM